MNNFIMTILISLVLLSCSSYKQDIQKIDTIFKEYAELQESIDSEANKTTLLEACEKLKEETQLKQEDILTLLDLWMYYDPTDFPTREITEKVFFNNLSESIKAIEYRQKHKNEWEKSDSAPFSELEELKNKLKKSQM